MTIANVDPDAYYSQEAATKLLGLSSRALGNAVRDGELRCVERAGKRFLRGEWIVIWLERPKTSDNYYALHSQVLDSFESSVHPESAGSFEIRREPTGNFDGKLIPSRSEGFVYVEGWLNGRLAAREDLVK